MELTISFEERTQRKPSIMSVTGEVRRSLAGALSGRSIVRAQRKARPSKTALAKKGTVAYKNKAAVKNLAASGKSVTLYAVWKRR
jgi:hypothetical protein